VIGLFASARIHRASRRSYPDSSCHGKTTDRVTRSSSSAARTLACLEPRQTDRSAGIMASRPSRHSLAVSVAGQGPAVVESRKQKEYDNDDVGGVFERVTDILGQELQMRRDARDSQKETADDVDMEVMENAFQTFVDTMRHVSSSKPSSRLQTFMGLLSKGQSQIMGTVKLRNLLDLGKSVGGVNTFSSIAPCTTVRISFQGPSCIPTSWSV